MSQDEEDIRESLMILLTTVAGERLLRPEYGAGMDNLMFEPLSVTTATIIINRIRRSIIKFEPRVKVEDIELLPQLLEGRVDITLSYTVISTNRRNNLVFPYYLNEATNV